MKNPNYTDATDKNPIHCDTEIIITAEISLIERGIDLSNDFPFETYKNLVKRKISELFGKERLKDDDIKVKVFLHEKSEKTPETE